MVRVRIQCLGGFSVQVDRKTVPEGWKRQQAKQLLKLLCCAPGHTVHREAVLEYLLPDTDPKKAKAALRVLLFVVRRVLDEGRARDDADRYIETIGEFLRLRSSRILLDIDRFEEAARTALRTRREADAEVARALYTGPLLPTDPYEEFTLDRREELARLYIRVLEMLSLELERAGRYDRTASVLRDILAADATREDIHRRLMAIYYVTAGRHAALRQYAECRAVLERDLDSMPDAETETLHAALLSDQYVSALPQPLREEGWVPPQISSAPRTPLLGRERVMEVLTGILTRAAGGVGGTVVLAGEAGIGKSRLAAEIGQVAVAGGIPVLWGTGHGEDEGPPYAAFVDALDQYVQHAGIPLRQAIWQTCPGLAALLPTSPLSPSSAPTERQINIYLDIDRALGLVSANGPLVLVLDDVQWADAGTLQVLNYLSRAAPTHHWLILCTVRTDTESGERRRRALFGRQERASVVHIDLLRLARHNSDRLVRAAAPNTPILPQDLDRLYALSLGNPLFLLELVRTGTKTPGSSGVVGTPSRALVDLMSRRLDGLDSDILDVLSIACVVGTEFSYRVVRQVSHLSDSDLLNSLDGALRAHMIEERGRLYAFHHPLLRTVLYDRLSRVRKAQLHGDVAEALELTRGEEVEALAYHYARSGKAGKALHYLEAAGDRAQTLQAHGVALARFDEALHLCSQNSMEETRLLEKLAHVQVQQGLHEEPLALLREIERRGREVQDWDTVIRARIRQSHVLMAHGLARKALSLLEEVTTEAGDAAQTVDVHLMRATLFQRLASYQRAAQEAEEAERLAGEDSGPRMRSAYLLAVARLGAGEMQNACHTLERVAAQADTSGDEEVLSAVLQSLSWVKQTQGRFADAAVLLRRSLAIAERSGSIPEVAHRLFRLSGLFYVQGRWKQARAYAERARAIIGTMAPTWAEPYPLLSLAWLARGEGRVEEARSLLAAALEMADQGGDLRLTRAVQRVLAELDLDERRPEDAIVRLTPLLDRHGMLEIDVPPLITVMAEAHLARAAPEIALRVAEWARDRTQDDGNVLVRIVSLGVIARAQAQIGLHGEAQWTLTEAEALLEGLEYPLGRAYLGLWRGEVRAHRGDLEGATADLHEAITRFHVVGAFLQEEQARSALSDVLRENTA